MTERKRRIIRGICCAFVAFWGLKAGLMIARMFEVDWGTTVEIMAAVSIGGALLMWGVTSGQF